MLNRISKAAIAALASTVLSASALGQAVAQIAHAGDSNYQSAAIIRSDGEVMLSSQKAGKLLVRKVREGQVFAKGDVLAEFDCDIDKARLKQAAAQLAYAQSKYQSEKELNRLNSGSALELALSLAELQTAKAEKTIQSKAVQSCSIVAPYDGTVIRWHAQAHQTIAENAQLVSIVNNQDLKLEFIWPSDQLSSIKEGAALQVYISERGEDFSAVVDRIVPQIDSVSKTVKVIANFSDDHAGVLWSGMSGTARLVDASIAQR